MNTEDEIKLLFQKATIANSNKKPFNYKKIFLFSLVSLFILSIFPSVDFYVYNHPLSSYKHIYSKTKPAFPEILISKHEKLIFKKLVRKIAQKENKHTNTIHAELRSRFNYRSYHQLNQQTYIKIKHYLTARLQ